MNKPLPILEARQPSIRSGAGKVLAELIMTNRQGKVTVIQVMDSSTFNRFYFWYFKAGILGRTSNRNNDSGDTVRLEDIPTFLDRHAIRPELMVATFLIKYHDRRAYERLINMSPDELGLTREKINPGRTIEMRSRFLCR